MAEGGEPSDRDGLRGEQQRRRLLSSEAAPDAGGHEAGLLSRATNSSKDAPKTKPPAFGARAVSSNPTIDTVQSSPVPSDPQAQSQRRVALSAHKDRREHDASQQRDVIAELEDI